MTWMANRKLCQTILPPWNIPFFIILFYFPCLFVWYWKSMWMPPFFSPPSRGSGEVLVKPSSAFAHLSSFNFLNGGMRGQKERQLSGFSPLLNHLSPKSVCFPLCVFVFALTGNTAFCSNIGPNVIAEPQFWCLLCHLLLYALILGRNNVGRSHTKLKCEFGFQAATNMTNDYLSEVYLFIISQFHIDGFLIANMSVWAHGVKQQGLHWGGWVCGWLVRKTQSGKCWAVATTSVVFG